MNDSDFLILIRKVVENGTGAVGRIVVDEGKLRLGYCCANPCSNDFDVLALVVSWNNYEDVLIHAVSHFSIATRHPSFMKTVVPKGSKVLLLLY